MHFLKRSDMATHTFTCKQAIPAFTPPPRSVTAFWLVLSLRSHGGQKAGSTWWLATYRNKVTLPGVETGHGHPSPD